VEEGSGHGQILHEVSIISANLLVHFVGERSSLLVIGKRAVSHVRGFQLAFRSLAEKLNQKIIVSAQGTAAFVDKGSISVKG
jgi:hypothetical protein